jgi:hypothetical protein
LTNIRREESGAVPLHRLQARRRRLGGQHGEDVVDQLQGQTPGLAFLAFAQGNHGQMMGPMRKESVVAMALAMIRTSRIFAAA